MIGRSFIAPAVVATSLLAIQITAWPQTKATAESTAPSRRAVQIDGERFVRSHHWDNAANQWLSNDGSKETPANGKSRQAVSAGLGDFLKNNRWDNVESKWVSLQQKPREISSLTREEVRTETRAFLKTHEFDPITSAWTLKPVSMKKK